MASTQMELRKRRGELPGAEPAATETASQEPDSSVTSSAGEPEPRKVAGANYTPQKAPAVEQAGPLKIEAERRRLERDRRRSVEGA